jgi:hypothetical protein
MMDNKGYMMLMEVAVVLERNCSACLQIAETCLIPKCEEIDNKMVYWSGYSWEKVA